MSESVSKRWNVRKAAVLGAGVMGSGISAHLASCGIPVLLLDIVPPDLSGDDAKDPAARNKFATGGLKAALGSRPPVFLDTNAAARIEVGNFDDDMAKIAECDWVIEVVKEDLAVKKALLDRVQKHWKPGMVLSTNTSGLSISAMMEGRSDDLKRHFLGTHFFNPVRYLHMLEIIPGAETDPQVVSNVADFADRYLGKGVVYAKDTPNFIGNRVGVYSMMHALQVMQEMDYTVEEVDAIGGPSMGRSKSAVFRTADVVGIDTLMHVARTCYDGLPDDPQQDVFNPEGILTRMVEKGLLGQKSRAGFTRKEKGAFQTLDFESLEYRETQKPDLSVLKALRAVADPGERLAKLLEDEGRAGQFAWKVLSADLAYTASIAEEIADDLVNIDRAICWGFNWEIGPFAAWQAIGVEKSVKRMRAEGLSFPAWIDDAIAAGGFYSADGSQAFVPGKGMQPTPAIPGQLSISAVRQSKGVVEENESASLLDLGDGIACVEFHTKANAIDPGMVEFIERACDLVEEGYDGMVIANEGAHFSAGANLALILQHIKAKNFDAVEQVSKGLQDACQRLKYLSKPVVTAPHGQVVGGGCEVAMAGDRMMVAQETYMGLVEVGVGLIPAGGGCLNLLKRAMVGIPTTATCDRLTIIQKPFETIALAKVAMGGLEVFKAGFGSAVDELSINSDRNTSDAKTLARYLADRGYTPPAQADNLILPGRGGSAAFGNYVDGLVHGGFASEHDAKIAGHVARVLCGGDTNGRVAVSEQQILDLERESFMTLCGEPKSVDRIEHMVTKNKPLRN
jgi:3-hydroxyacyl-CoA dehydrogenase